MNAGVYRGERLQDFICSETQHCSFASSDWQMTILDPVVCPPANILY
jgi:hypothetical protein